MAPKRRGFGRLRQLPSGRWQASYTGPDAKVHKAARTYATQTDAEGWLAAERRKIDLGAWASNAYVIEGNPQESPPDDDGEPRSPGLPPRNA